jgi:hypothetical protein
VDLTDEELTAEALAADPDAPLADDAVPLDLGGDGDAGPLPNWYMPAPGSGRSRGRVMMLTVLAGSLIAGNVAGFCVTFGFPEFVWH